MEVNSANGTACGELSVKPMNSAIADGWDLRPSCGWSRLPVRRCIEAEGEGEHSPLRGTETIVCVSTGLEEWVSW